MVSLGRVCSERPFFPTSGVAQGSILGPLLFLIFIWALSSTIHTNILQYADDVKFFRVIRSAEDCILLQHDIHNLLRWFDQHLLTVNISKTKAMRFTRKVSPIDFQYSDASGHQIDFVEVVSDLGVIFDPKLTFHAHTEKVKREALRILGGIMFTMSDFKDPRTYLNLLTTYVKPKLWYTAVAFNCLTLGDYKKLDTVVNKYCRFVRWRVLPFRNLSTQQVREKLGILPIHTMFSISDAKFFYDMMHNKIDSSTLLQDIGFHLPPRRSRHTHLLEDTGSAKNPMIRGAFIWNRVKLDVFTCRRTEIDANVSILNTFR